MKRLAKNMTTLITICFIGGLVGCGVLKKDIDDCVKLCVPNDGVDEMWQLFPGGLVHCRCGNKLEINLGSERSN